MWSLIDGRRTCTATNTRILLFTLRLSVSRPEMKTVHEHVVDSLTERSKHYCGSVQTDYQILVSNTFPPSNLSLPVDTLLIVWRGVYASMDEVFVSVASEIRCFHDSFIYSWQLLIIF